MNDAKNPHDDSDSENGNHRNGHDPKYEIECEMPPPLTETYGEWRQNEGEDVPHREPLSIKVICRKSTPEILNVNYTY
jgi:hypothetical protein